MNPNEDSLGFTKIRGKSTEFSILDRFASAADNLPKCENGLSLISYGIYIC
jgi:hypothetical protein